VIADSDDCLKYAIQNGEHVAIELEDPEPDGPHYRANTGMVLHHSCMLQKGYAYQPRWHPKRGSRADPAADDAGCRKGREFHIDPLAYDAYAMCMSERGWTRYPRR
jgi:hypothetical protein